MSKVTNSFAEQQLKKYGWEQGQGLGKRKGMVFTLSQNFIAYILLDGMSKPISVSVKNDTLGVHYNSFDHVPYKTLDRR